MEHGTKSDLEREIATLERALNEAVRQAVTVRAALDDLEGHRSELAGRLALAHRAAQDYEARLQESREEHARALESLAKLEEVVDVRDEAANSAADAVRQLIASLDRLNTVREELAERVVETETKLGRRAELRPEPERLEHEWARLVELVRAERAQSPAELSRF